MQLNQCARAAGISADTPRHYLREGLVEAAGRADNGYRTFDDRTVARVRFIRSAVGLGFTLADVAELLRMSAHGDLPCPRARQLLGIDKAHSEFKLAGAAPNLWLMATMMAC